MLLLLPPLPPLLDDEDLSFLYTVLLFLAAEAPPAEVDELECDDG